MCVCVYNRKKNNKLILPNINWKDFICPWNFFCLTFDIISKSLWNQYQVKEEKQKQSFISLSADKNKKFLHYWTFTRKQTKKNSLFIFLDCAITQKHTHTHTRTSHIDGPSPSLFIVYVCNLVTQIIKKNVRLVTEFIYYISVCNQFLVFVDQRKKTRAKNGINQRGNPEITIRRRTSYSHVHHHHHHHQNAVSTIFGWTMTETKKK